jgi:hypothetical protein
MVIIACPMRQTGSGEEPQHMELAFSKPKPVGRRPGVEKSRISLCLLVLLVAFHAHGQSPGVPHPATDDLGRVLPSHKEVGDLRPNKMVALFYWTWHVGHSQINKAFNNSKIIEGYHMELSVPRVLLGLKPGQKLEAEPEVGSRVQMDRHPGASGQHHGRIFER